MSLNQSVLLIALAVAACVVLGVWLSGVGDCC
jgi:hypothetical protein